MNRLLWSIIIIIDCEIANLQFAGFEFRKQYQKLIFFNENVKKMGKFGVDGFFNSFYYLFIRGKRLEMFCKACAAKYNLHIGVEFFKKYK